MKKSLIIFFLITIIVLSYTIYSYIVKQNAEVVIYEDDFYYITYNGNTYTSCSIDDEPSVPVFSQEKHRATLYEQCFLLEPFNRDYILISDDGNYLKLETNSLKLEREYYKIREYNSELLELSGKENDVVCDKEIIMEEIMKVYVPSSELGLLSRGVNDYDISPLLKYCNVEKTYLGFRLTIEMDEEIFVMGTRYDGSVKTMFFCQNELHKIDEFSSVKKGMQFENVKKIFPEIVLYEKIAFILNDKQPLLDSPFADVVFDDGSIGVVWFEKKDGEYYVTDTKLLDYPTVPKVVIQDLK